MIPLSDLSLDPQSADCFIKRNTCSCGGRLTVAFVNRQYVLRCGENKEHNGIRPTKTNVEELEELMEKQSIALGKPVQKEK